MAGQINTKMFLTLFLVNIFLMETKSARILCVFPMPSVSHQLVFKAFTQALAKRGHELVIITTNPTVQKERPKDNITEIDIGGNAFAEFSKIITINRNNGLAKLGFIYDVRPYTTDDTVPLFSTICSNQFKLPEVKQLINDKTQKFDLIIMESIIEFPLILSKIFRAPVIYFSSFYGTSENYHTMGAVGGHPFLYPQSHRTFFGGDTIWDRLKEIYWDWKVIDFYRKVKENTNRLLKIQFGPETPTIDELRQNIALMFLNLHPMLDSNRPVPPSVIYLGALHLQEAKEINLLSEDLKNMLNKSKNGVVYVSFGTVIRPSEMNTETLNIFFEAFKSLPYDVIWKFDADHLDNKPENVIIRKWVPQRDLLGHPKVKAFVTQGGLQSIDEAIEAGIPFVGIPMVADQWFNVYQTTKMGISIKLEATSLTATDLSTSIRTIIDDKSYKENVLKIRFKMRDQIQNPMERAIWWTEHVLRHGGATHLRSPAANISWSEYLMLDIIVAILTVTIFLVFVFILSMIWLMRQLSWCFKPKVKLS